MFLYISKLEKVKRQITIQALHLYNFVQMWNFPNTRLNCLLGTWFAKDYYNVTHDATHLLSHLAFGIVQNYFEN